MTDLSTAEQRAAAMSRRRELEQLRQRHGEWCSLTWPHEGPCSSRAEVERLKRVIRRAHNDLNDRESANSVRSFLWSSLVFPPSSQP